MAQNVTLVALSQMVDLSLNCGEGSINFQALHILLHVIIQQLALNDIGVEFRGPDSDRIQALISSAKTKPNLYPEYSIVGQKGKRRTSVSSKKQISLQDVIKEKQIVEDKKEKELRVIERRKDSKEDPDPHPLPLKSPQGSLLGITPPDIHTVVLIESQSTLPQYTVAVSKAAFDGIQADIGSIREEIKELKELPGNFGLIEATRKDTGPILDMFQILNLTKRMDATETAIQKLGSLVEDVAKIEFTGDITEKLQEVHAAVESSGTIGSRSKHGSTTNLEIRVAQLERDVKELTERGGTILDRDQSQAGASDLDEGRSEKHKGAGTSGGADADEAGREEHASGARGKRSVKPEVIKMLSPQEPYISGVRNIDLSELTPEDAFAVIQEEFNNLSKWMVDSLKDVEKSKVIGEGSGGEVSSTFLESKFKEYAQQLAEMNDFYNTKIGALNEQFNNVQNDMNDVFTKLEVVLPGGDSTGIGAETTMDLANKLALLEKEIVAIAEQAAKLEEEKVERDKQTDAILEQLDVLKIVKANREDLEDALGEKADACVINRKVSHDQFDAACDDLSRGIEEALNRLEEQAEMWQQALDTIQKDVGNKLDKNEVDPLRDFVNSKLRALQEKFKSLTALKREQEAAGTKSKLLRNVNCISCDKDVVMKTEMDPTLKPKAYAMPPSRNMAPYLAYELDQLRKQQKCVPGSKNLNFIETALKTRGQKDKDHICNRYCGGSHTVTTPQQRVTRLGHFLEQWGPEIAPLQDEYIKGYDNHMYRGRDESLYKKANKRENQGKKTGKDAIPSRGYEEPQQDRNALVDSAAQAAITNQEHSKSNTNKRVTNIGSLPLTPHEMGDASQHK